MATVRKYSQLQFSMGRRNFLSTALGAFGIALGVTGGLWAVPRSYADSEGKLDKREGLLKIALLHVSPRLGDVAYNCNLVESAMRSAAASGATWLVSPELCLTGYRFEPEIGTGWITPGPDKWVQRLQAVAAELGVTLFLGHLERSRQDDHCYNTVFVIDDQGHIAGRHRKINTIPVSESWSTPGDDAVPVDVNGYRVGILICADAWPSEHAVNLQRQGAQLLVSCANWAPGIYGPRECWEKRSIETALPVMVCNRTGIEARSNGSRMNMTEAKSVVVSGGKRLVNHCSEQSTVLLVDWDQRLQTVVRTTVTALASGQSKVVGV